MALAHTFLGYLFDNTNTTTPSFGSVSPSEAGLLVICVAGRGNVATTITDVTVGGVSASLTAADTGSNINTGVMAVMEVVAGTYAIAAVSASTLTRCSVSCYLLTGYASATPVDTGVDISGTTTSKTVSLDYPTGGGLGIYVANHNNTNATSWSVAAADHDTTLESAAKISSATRSASGSSVSETASWSGTPSAALLGAVWEPAAAGSGNPHYYYQNQAVAA